MFKRKIAKARSVFAELQTSPFWVEGLEDRRLLSGHHHGDGGFGGGGGFNSSSSIAFSLLPTSVQNGLDSLAGTDSVTAPTATSKIILGNNNGVETYTYDVTGTDTTLTVDTSGNLVTAPTKTTTTFDSVGNSAVTDEITAIASGLGLTTPTSSTVVSVVTPAGGTATYSVTLAASSKTSSRHNRGTTITVDADGNPVGNERVPLSTLSTAIQNGLTSNAPSGATALTSTSLVNVQTQYGVTTYSVTYRATGVRTTVIVDSTGAKADLPSRTSTTFSALSSDLQAELQALATGDGAGTIDDSANVTELDEGNGTTLYSIRVTATDGTTSDTYPVTLTIDENGNPTVLNGGGGGDRGGPGGPGGGGFGGPGGGCGPSDDGDNSSSSTSTTVTSSARHRRR